MSVCSGHDIPRLFEVYHLPRQDFCYVVIAANGVKIASFFYLTILNIVFNPSFRLWIGCTTVYNSQNVLLP